MKDTVRDLRGQLSWTQADLAEKLGVSRQTVNAIETEKYDPDLPLALEMAKLFRRPVEEILKVQGVLYSCLEWYNTSAMAISIKSIEAERLAREIAAKTGESLTGAIQKALEERLERLKQQRRSQVLAGQLEDILRRVDQLPVLDSRTPDEILGYDENGLPR